MLDSLLGDLEVCVFIKKVILQAIKIRNGEAATLTVGNIDISRDFGWAPKYVEAMYLMLQQKLPDDFLICSNHSVTLRSVVEYVFNYLNVSMECLIIDEKLFRPTEIADIYGNNALVKLVLGWKYQMTFFEVL